MKTSKATVQNVSSDGILIAKVRRNFREERIQGHHFDVQAGDIIDVYRQANNPFLQRLVPPTLAQDPGSARIMADDITWDRNG